MRNIYSSYNLDFKNYLINYLTGWVNDRPRRQNLAIVFDIDDTIINPRTRKPLEKIKEIYNFAIKNNIAVFFVTARFNTKQNSQLTIQELNKTGFGKFANLFMMPFEYYFNNQIGLYKFRARTEILKKKTIILNIGDQWSDLYSSPMYHANFKENKYYLIPDSREGLMVKLKSYY